VGAATTHIKLICSEYFLMQVKLSKNGQPALNRTIRVGALPTTCTNLEVRRQFAPIVVEDELSHHDE
jgi:hypothetical protein